MPDKMSFGRYDCAMFTAFIAYAACSIGVPITLTALAASLDFPLQAGGMGAGGALQMGRSLPMLLSMLAAGFAAARWGKSKVISGGLIMMCCGIAGAALSPGYGILFAAVALAGLGEGTIEALATPVIQDVHPISPARYINFAHSFWSIGILLFTLGAGALLWWGVSWRVVLAICAASTLIPLLILLTPYRGPQNPDPPHASKNRREVGHDIAKLAGNGRFWLFFAAIFLAGGGEFGLTFWTPALIEIGCRGNAFAAGAGAAIFSLGMVCGRMGAGFLVRRCKLRVLLLGMSVAGSVFALLIMITGSLTLLYVLLFFVGIASGPFWPSLQSHCVDRVNGDSTMIYILLSCAGIPGCGFFTWMLGVIGDHWGIQRGFLVVPVCYALLGVLVAIEPAFARRRKRT